MNSILTKSQKKFFGPKYYTEDGTEYRITATVRYDDQCGNGHNTFAITGEIDRKSGNGRWIDDAGGCIHDHIAKHFPELAQFIKWHLVSSDGPMYYLENTLYNVLEHGPKNAWVYFDDPANGIIKKCMKYCSIEEAIEMCTTPSKTFNYVSKAGYRYEVDEKTAKKAELDHARSSAVWPEAADEELRSPDLKEKLIARLPAIMAAFKKDVEALGFTY